MQTSNKITPKSCSCGQCTYSKNCKACKKLMKSEERSFRRTSNLLAKQLSEDIPNSIERKRQG